MTTGGIGTSHAAGRARPCKDAKRTSRQSPARTQIGNRLRLGGGRDSRVPPRGSLRSVAARVAGGKPDGCPPPTATLGKASNLDGDGTPHRPGRRVHRPSLRRHPRRGVRAPRAARRRLDAGRRPRDEPLRDGLPPPRRRPLPAALVHSRGRGGSVRSRHARVRARAVGGRASRPRQSGRVSYAQRPARRRAPGRVDRARLPSHAPDPRGGAARPRRRAGRKAALRREDAVRLPGGSGRRGLRAGAAARSRCARACGSPRRDGHEPRVVRRLRLRVSLLRSAHRRPRGSRDRPRPLRAGPLLERAVEEEGSPRLAGYLFALAAGATWGTTGPLSTALYGEGAAITGIGFWRILLGTLGLVTYGALFHRDLFRIDRAALLLVGVGGGALVALFEVAYQFGIAGAGVAGAAALLYVAPVLVALLAKPLLGEALTPLRLALAVVVMLGAALTVRGGSHGTAEGPVRLAAGVAGGLLAAASYASSTLLARFAVPRYGALRVLLLEIAGGTLILGIVLPLAGHPPAPPPTLGGWVYIAALVLGPVLGANFLFFAGVRRIDAAPTAVAATIEPVVGALLALLLFDQHLRALGWLGLAMVVGGVAGG